MKQLLFNFLFFSLTFNLNAQVGINNTDPQASLDVAGQPSTSTVMDGILPPRISGNQLQAKSYSSAQNGAIVYVTQPSASPSGQTVNVTSEGLFVFNSISNQWIALAESKAGLNVYCNNDNPNNATIFDAELPAITNSNSLKENIQNTYYGLDASTWIWSGTSYTTKTQNFNLNIDERVTVFKTMDNSVANNTILSSPGLIELDGVIRIDIRKIDNLYYSPRILNISGSAKTITYQTFASQTNQAKNVVNGILPNNTAYDVDNNGIVFWTTTATEVITTNLILPNNKWYEIQWYAFESASTKHIYFSALRIF